MRRIAGVGLGLRWEFVARLVDELPRIDFLEVAPENYVGRGGYQADALAYLAETYPLLTHGLSMSLGGTDPLGADYLGRVRDTVRSLASPWHSDHLSFGTSQGRRLHDLLPIAFTEAGVRRVADRVRQAEDAVGVPMAVENISFYLPPEAHEMPEAEFIARVCERAGCGLLLDVNNLFVNATNFGFDARAWLDVAPLDRVVQIHVAGHDWFDESIERKPPHSPGALILDTHGAAVSDSVLELFGHVMARVADVPVVLERDYDVPPLEVLLAELETLRAIVASAKPTEQSAGFP